MRGQLSDADWKSGPKESNPTASEHAIHREDFGRDFDFDGFGVEEAEAVDGEMLITIQESVECHRDGCDATHKRRLLFTTQPLSDTEKSTLVSLSGVNSIAAHTADVAERAGPESIDIDGLLVTAETIIEDVPTGSCYGRVEPDPDVHAHRYDL